MRQHDKSAKLATVWVGECVCGLIVREVSDGTRFLLDATRRHSPSECGERMRLRRDDAEPAHEMKKRDIA